jgi:hypothetical protein
MAARKERASPPAKEQRRVEGMGRDSCKGKQGGET